MNEWMPGQYGWVDRGPTKAARVTKSGPVRVRLDDQTHIRPAYSPAEVRLIVKRGEEDPRELTPAQQTIANRNRQAYEADQAVMEKWARDGFCVPEGDR